MKKDTGMKNTNDMIEKLNEILCKLDNGELSIQRANAMNNTVGHVIKENRLQLEYNNFRGKHGADGKIDFLEN